MIIYVFMYDTFLFLFYAYVYFIRHTLHSFIYFFLSPLYLWLVLFLKTNMTNCYCTDLSPATSKSKNKDKWTFVGELGRGSKLKTQKFSISKSFFSHQIGRKISWHSVCFAETILNYCILWINNFCYLIACHILDNTYGKLITKPNIGFLVKSW